MARSDLPASGSKQASLWEKCGKQCFEHDARCRMYILPPTVNGSSDVVKELKSEYCYI